MTKRAHRELLMREGTQEVWCLFGMIYWYATEPQSRRASKEPTEAQARRQFDVRTLPDFDTALDRAAWGSVLDGTFSQERGQAYHRAVILAAIQAGHSLAQC